MDDATAGQRLKTLHDQIAQLTIRADELTDALSGEPAPPPPGVIEDLQAYLADAIASGTPAERQAAIEALVAEVRITDHGLIPVFRIPSPPAGPPRQIHHRRRTRGSHNAEVGEVFTFGFDLRERAALTVVSTG